MLECGFRVNGRDNVGSEVVEGEVVAGCCDERSKEVLLVVMNDAMRWRQGFLLDYDGDGAGEEKRVPTGRWRRLGYLLA